MSRVGGCVLRPLSRLCLKRIGAQCDGRAQNPSEVDMKGWPGEPQMAYDELMARDAAAAAEGAPITQVIFDFGNVLLYWDPEAVMIPRYSQRLVDGFLDNDISSFYDANDLMDAGASLEEGVAYVREHKGEPWASMMRYYVDNFRDSLTGVVTGARVLIDDLHAAGIGVWGLSNWQQDLYQIADRDCDLLGMLDGKVVSGQVRMRKPNRDIYEYALHSFGIRARDSVFIDDKAMNIVGANQAGIRGIRFRDPRKLRACLIAAGVPIPPVRD